MSQPPHPLSDPAGEMLSRMGSAALRQRLQQTLGAAAPRLELPRDDGCVPSVVLVPLAAGIGNSTGVCLILNKRSRRVRQPGDLCCPGGGLHPILDPLGARLLTWPGSPLWRGPVGRRWRKDGSRRGRRLRTLLAAALREGFEEMRLNPLRVEVLGLLPRQDLVMFRRVIFPMVVWVHGPRRFRPNWEVESILEIPLARLLEEGRYRRCRFQMPEGAPEAARFRSLEFPCFAHQTPGGTEWLWGATFRIVLNLLETTLGFAPPPPERLPPVTRMLDPRYLDGR